MDMEQAAFWLAGCIMFGLGVIVLAIVGVVINNILHRYWKPVKLFTPDSWKAFNPPERFVESTEVSPKQLQITDTAKSEPKLKAVPKVKTK
jgi:hypothetical protein